MANGMRKKSANTVVWVLMALLILGLGGFGITNFGGRSQAIGTVGDRDIPINDYARALNREIQAFSAQVGAPVPFAQAQSLGIDRTVQSQLFAGAALDNETRRIGVSIGDKELQARILQIDAFKNIAGTFDRDTYTQALRREGMTEGEFEGKLRDEAARTLLQGAVMGGVDAPAAYVDTLASYITETRNFTLTKLLPSDLAEPVGAPDDAALKAYYDAHPDEFTRPEIRKISYALLTPDMLTGKVQVDDAALRADYEKRKSEFVTPEKRLVERLVYATEDEAKAALAKVTAGSASFADLAKERGLTLADADLGEVSKEDLGTAGDAVFALTEPGVVGPLTTNLGPALFSMNGILEAKTVTFEEARDDLSAEVALDRARRMIQDEANNLSDQLAGGETIEKIADSSDMTFGNIDYSMGTEDGIAAYKEFRDAAAAATPEDFPQLVELADGGVFALRLDAIDPPALKPLDAVRDDVAAAWTKAETERRLTELGAEISAQLDNRATLESLGLVTTSYKDFGRDGFIADAPTAVAETVFKTEQGKSAVVDAEGSVHVLFVDAVTKAPADDADHMRIRQAVELQTQQSIAQDMFDLFTQAVEAEAGVTLNANAVNAVHAQMQ